MTAPDQPNKLNLFVISDDFAKGDDDLFLHYLAYTWRHSPLAFEYDGAHRSDWTVGEIRQRIADNDCFVVAVVDKQMGEKTSAAVETAKQHGRGHIVAVPLTMAFEGDVEDPTRDGNFVTFDIAATALAAWMVRQVQVKAAP